LERLILLSLITAHAAPQTLNSCMAFAMKPIKAEVAFGVRRGDRQTRRRQLL
jgi:hypothetical protein